MPFPGTVEVLKVLAEALHLRAQHVFGGVIGGGSQVRVVLQDGGVVDPLHLHLDWLHGEVVGSFRLIRHIRACL